MTLAFHPAEPSPFVRALLADQGIAAGAVDLAIDARDEMLGFLLASQEGDRERALYAYFRSGLSIADALTQVLAWRFGDPAAAGAVLDFASGYGRVTRFLLRGVPAGRLWVADVYAEGVRFQAERFGVHGVVSTVRPEEFACAERFDAIFVTSLFTHLPAERFVAWLRVLLGLLRPGGVLAFSVHDEELLPPGVALPEPGLLFQELSESGSLATRDYGSTWVSERFVRAALERAAAEPVAVCRLPRGLCNFQDLYVAVRAAGVDFSGFAFQGEPQLQIDECSLQIQAPAPDRLALRGWAIVRSGSVREVQVTLDGELLATAPVGAPRPDVAALFGERFLACGWECACALPPGASRSAAVLIVRVVDGRGTGQPLWAGSLEGALLASSRQLAAHLTRELAAAQGRLAAAEARVAAAEARAAHEAAELCARIAAMEASRFWKARNAWFRVKGRLGVG